MYDPHNTQPPIFPGNTGNRGLSRPTSWLYRQKRPLGVTIIALWAFFSAAFGLWEAFASLKSAIDFGLRGPYFAIGCYDLFWVPVEVAIGVGLWNLRHWARIWWILIAILGVVILFFTQPLAAIQLVLVLNAASVVYLIQPRVHALFER